MKKVLISVLLVLLTLCLFVSCSNEPKVKEETNCNIYHELVLSDNGELYDFSYDTVTFVSNGTKVWSYRKLPTDWYSVKDDKSEISIQLSIYETLDIPKTDRGVLTFNGNKLTLRVGDNTIYSDILPMDD